MKKMLLPNIVCFFLFLYLAFSLATAAVEAAKKDFFTLKIESKKIFHLNKVEKQLCLIQKGKKKCFNVKMLFCDVKSHPADCVGLWED